MAEDAAVEEHESIESALDAASETLATWRGHEEGLIEPEHFGLALGAKIFKAWCWLKNPLRTTSCPPDRRMRQKPSMS